MKKIIPILFLFVTSVFGQYSVEFNEIKGEINSRDKFKSGFGRYDGYEIEFYQNEIVNFLVFPESHPLTVLFVDPDGKVFMQSRANAGGVAVLSTQIPKQGEWALLIVADSNATVCGYTLQYAFAASNSVKPDDDADFCSQILFLTEHAKANFILFQAPVSGRSGFVKLSGSSDSFVDENDGSYIAKYYEGDNIREANKIYTKLVEDIKNCLPKEWDESRKDWNNVEDFKVKGAMFSNLTDINPRYVQISLFDFTDSKERFTGNFVVQLEIRRAN
ncbi:hypothetical protein MROS_2583 [Melioribacter roseus P3M-2]|uniref:Uncharacterized protein n=1 Tax=Melioribacter roseus (strain DSM 23840 / JCM 17771 / VKM B-2668 / P3M-2) TaxID=1191523 RepID=I7A3M0_MELRP|nr:hypothetical protein [Melioribacter roseus]AFN75813.1 hypothetical protein MROS_2583 [Melioribacter roseus P3M-2]